MAEPERMTQVKQETSRGKSGKGKAIIKRSKADAPARDQEEASADGPPLTEGRQNASVPPAGKRALDPEILAQIRQRAYALFEERGHEHGHELEHWLEAERQVTGSSEQSER
jgi:hypothetical protein